jgi:hypothetical protein
MAKNIQVNRKLMPGFFACYGVFDAKASLNAALRLSAARVRRV